MANNDGYQGVTYIPHDDHTPESQEITSAQPDLGDFLAAANADQPTPVGEMNNNQPLQPTETYPTEQSLDASQHPQTSDASNYSSGRPYLRDKSELSDEDEEEIEDDLETKVKKIYDRLTILEEAFVAYKDKIDRELKRVDRKASKNNLSPAERVYSVMEDH